MSDEDELLIVDKRCSVTMFDMHVQVSRDGRKRGIWVLLDDSSDVRAITFEKWLEDAAVAACRIMGMDGNQTLAFKAWMALNGELRQLSNGKIHEGALLEWPEVKEVFEALSKEPLVLHAIGAGVKARKPRKPDRRAAPARRLDDKTKARLRR